MNININMNHGRIQMRNCRVGNGIRLPKTPFLGYKAPFEIKKG